MVRFLIPLVGFFVLAGLLYIGLGQNPTIVSSPFIGKPAPKFTVPTLHKPEQNMSRYGY